MICPLDPLFDCPYEDLLDSGDMTCEECEVCEK